MYCILLVYVTGIFITLEKVIINVLNRVISITIIVFLLLAQASEVYASSSMSCFGNKTKTMHAEKEPALSHKSNGMVSSMTDDSFDMSDESMTHECCQQECDCPSVMLSVAALMDINTQAFFTAKYTLFTNPANGLVQVFILSQQRPPKPLYFS